MESDSWCAYLGWDSSLQDMLNFAEPSFPHLKNPKVVRIIGVNPCKVLSQALHIVSM